MKHAIHTRILPIVVAVLATLGTVHAGGHGHGKGQGHGPGHGMQRMIEQLELSSEQAEAVKEVFERQRLVMEAAHAGGRQPNDAEREAHRTALDASLAKVLTEEQMTQLQGMRANRRHGQGKGKGQGKGYGHGAGHGARSKSGQGTASAEADG